PAVSVAANAAAGASVSVASVGSAASGIVSKASHFVKGVIGNLKASIPALAKGAGIGAAISGVVSLAVNGYQTFVAKTMTTRQMAGAVAADTVTGGISSLGGMAAGGAGVGIAGTALAGLPLTLLTIGAGIAGSMITGRMMDGLGIHQAIATAISGPATAAAAAPAQ
ncbi:MAG: hypothetical protein H7338_13020, partial [Candidatus Sericytochromatia bacterium]|nr:hypothetical protein [Candidatus Sericytochromatia bacterium]